MSSRAWSSFSFASTSRKETAWNSWIGPPERLRSFAYVDRVLECGAAEPERARRELHACDVEHVHQPAEALTFRAEPAIVRHEARVEEELARREAAAAELRQPRPDARNRCRRARRRTR